MRNVGLVGLLGALVFASGCFGTMAGQGISTVTGASGRYFEIRDMGAKNALDRYQAIQVEAFDPQPMLGSIPRDVLDEVQPAIVRRLRDTRLFAQVGPNVTAKPALIIRGKFTDYDPGGSALRVVGFGSNPSLTAQVEMVDAETSRVLGIAMVSSMIKSQFRTGAGEYGDGIAKAIKGLLSGHMVREPPEEDGGHKRPPSRK